ncbi:MAG: sensor histidine kinase [Gammaproteobacteria bacterium]
MTKIARPVIAPLLWVHHRLLPQDQWTGWVPYLWLPYLAFLYLPWPGEPLSPFIWAMRGLGGALFLVLYFRIHWAHTRERYWLLGAITALGLLFTAVPGNGQVFIIYAGALCGMLGAVRRSFIVLGAIIAAALIEAAALWLPPWYWGFGVFFGLMVGFANIYFGEAQRKNRALKQSQAEIQKLAAVAERERIARDLHDLLGHTLTLITVKAELASKLAEHDLPAAAREIREVEAISRDALRQVREAVGGYRSGGLAAELANARVALAAAEVELDENVASPTLTPEQDTALALALREAVTNVVRHSEARRCRIELANRNGELNLSIEDDGRGGKLQEGNGLKGMRERLRALSGRLDLHSDPTGTRLCICLPARHAQAFDVSA